MMIDHAIPTAEANRRFSYILREVRDGVPYIVTVHDKPVARIVRCEPADAARANARSAPLQRLQDRLSLI
jgi:prevent-host-death family protein